MDETASRRAGPQLLGTDYATVDSKGRVLIAKKKRDRLGDGFAAAITEKGVLTLYPGERWDALLERIYSHDSMGEARQEYLRLFTEKSDDGLSFDEQGRFVIPRSLRQASGLKEEMEVTIVGAGDRLEIWSNDEWAEYEKDRAGYNLPRRQQYEAARAAMIAESELR